MQNNLQNYEFGSNSSFPSNVKQTVDCKGLWTSTVVFGLCLVVGLGKQETITQIYQKEKSKGCQRTGQIKSTIAGSQKRPNTLTPAIQISIPTKVTTIFKSFGSRYKTGSGVIPTGNDIKTEKLFTSSKASKGRSDLSQRTISNREIF